MKNRCCVLFLFAMFTAGCGPSSVKMTSFSPTEIAANAIAEYDTNQDGVLDLDELENAPSLNAALSELDTDRDRRVTEAEIAAVIENWNSSGVGITTVECDVLMNGKPLPAVEVVFEPESFMGSNVGAATGQTDEVGHVTPIAPIANEYGIPGMQLGFYRVKISGLGDTAGSVPANYNDATVLGRAVSPHPRTPVGDFQLRK